MGLIYKVLVRPYVNEVSFEKLTRSQRDTFDKPSKSLTGGSEDNDFAMDLQTRR